MRRGKAGKDVKPTCEEKSKDAWPQKAVVGASKMVELRLTIVPPVWQGG